MNIISLKDYVESGKRSVKKRKPSNDNTKGKGRPPEPFPRTTSGEYLVYDHRGTLVKIVPRFP